VTVIDTPWGGIGIGICYDIRFPELSMLMRERGANIMIYPGAFNMVTGPAHWQLLQRARAVDNQVTVNLIIILDLPIYYSWLLFLSTSIVVGLCSNVFSCP
jgi:hypothetical protein